MSKAEQKDAGFVSVRYKYIRPANGTIFLHLKYLSSGRIRGNLLHGFVRFMLQK